VVVTHSEKIKKHSDRFIAPENHRFLVETLRETSQFWNSKTTILLGDVFYTASAAKKIKKCKELTFFGDSSEIFALVFTERDHEMMKKALDELILKSVLGEIRCKLWHLYRYFNNIDLNEHTITDHFTRLTDGTQDFDNWDQYLKYAKNKRI